MKEAETLKTIIDYLGYCQNLGRLVYFRLNSGTFVVENGKSRRVIRGTQKGTADILVIRLWYPEGAPNKAETIVTFFEVKSDTGKQTGAQKEFEERVKKQGAGYFIVRSVTEVQELFNTD